ncbi:guanylate kinase [Hydrogenobacter sp. T-2]|uniref:guanylate kinase n=1 Tax=Pampinifervens diazotrophicum TaxID=1632018 RepID=UPI002B25E10F|nr:guanylate kinase [Hydrogenobacter sp. T-2]WPM33003.1 guanylate kinase [Hydrogenobacter sp. T-2]
MLFVLSAPSGTGKTTIADRLLKSCPKVKRIITATTRPQREGEVHGVDYIFMDREEFERKIEEGYFLEYAKVYGNYYGTPKDQVLRNEEEGIDSLLVIDVQGAKKVKEVYPENVLIFLMPPSLEELRRRLLGRGYGRENLEQRLQKAEEEIACAKHFDYIVVNEFIDKTVEALHTIIVAHRYRRENFLKKPNVNDEAISRILSKVSCKSFESL